MATRVQVPNYLARFRCIGGACEDNCCHGWTVIFDQDTHNDLERRMAPDNAEQFRENVRLCDDPTDRAYSQIVMRPDGTCPFITADGLCSVQAQHGEEALSYTCAVFPRSLVRLGGHAEATASLGCPEVARLCLLATDGTDLTDMPASALPRCEGPINALDTTNPYSARFFEARATVLELLSDCAYPLSSRLFFVAWFANHMNAEFRRNGTADGDALFRQAQQLVTDGAPRQQLHQMTRQLAVTPDVPVAVIHTVLTRLTETGIHELLRALLGSALDGYRQPGASAAADLSVQGIAARYAQRRDACQTRFGERLELVFGNYCRDYWLHDSYLQSESLLEHTLGLLTRLVILRFILFSQPELDDVLESDTQDALDRLIIRVTYGFTRGIGHSTTFLKIFRDIVSEQNLDSLAHLAIFARF